MFGSVEKGDEGNQKRDYKRENLCFVERKLDRKEVVNWWDPIIFKYFQLWKEYGREDVNRKKKKKICKGSILISNFFISL